MSRERSLTALLGSRICHDLISPIGAIGNGVELLTMTGGGETPEIALIADSVGNASARIRFFRVAFGAADPGQSVPGSEIRTILADLGRGSRLQVRWDVAGDPSRADAKLAFLLILCFETSMPRGGELRVSEADGRWTLVTDAERLRPDPALWGLFGSPDAPPSVTAAQIQFALVGDAAAQAGRTVATDLDPDRIRVTF